MWLTNASFLAIIFFSSIQTVPIDTHGSSNYDDEPTIQVYISGKTEQTEPKYQYQTTGYSGEPCKCNPLHNGYLKDQILLKKSPCKTHNGMSHRKDNKEVYPKLYAITSYINLDMQSNKDAEEYSGEPYYWTYGGIPTYRRYNEIPEIDENVMETYDTKGRQM